MRNASLVFQSTGPPGDQWRCDSALIVARLVIPEWRVAQRGDCRPLIEKGIHAAGTHTRRHFTSIVERHLMTRTVVGENKDQRVIEFVGLLQRGHGIGEAAVNALDHRGVNRHPFDRQVSAGCRFRADHRVMQRCAFGDQTRGNLALQSRLHQRFAVVLLIQLSVESNVLLFRLKRPVRRVVGHVNEERLVAPG